MTNRYHKRIQELEAEVRTKDGQIARIESNLGGTPGTAAQVAALQERVADLDATESVQADRIAELEEALEKAEHANAAGAKAYAELAEDLAVLEVEHNELKSERNALAEQLSHGEVGE